jgi:rsbT co-antagonist protein RsbR
LSSVENARMESEVRRMESSQARLAEAMRGSQSKLIDRWAEILSAAVSHRISAPELRRELDELFVLVVRSMGQDESAAGELRAVLAEMSRDRARRGFSPRETAMGVFSLKDAVYELVAGSDDLVAAYIVFARYVDDLGLYTFETFASAREQVITDQAESMLELSTPVVRLWHGIIAVPLVGTLDSARTQLVMEKMLDALVATEAEHAVIDITGVPTVDTEVAQHLLKTVVAARLMGAECIITGIRPQIAHTIVSLGIEFGDVPTMQTLADGLKHALRRSGLKVVQA